MKNILKKISSGILVALFALTGAIGLFSPKAALAADCDVNDVSVYVVPINNTDYTNFSGIDTWDQFRNSVTGHDFQYGDFSDGNVFTYKIRGVVKTTNCIGKYISVGVFSQSFGSINTPISSDLLFNALPAKVGTDEYIVVDFTPGEDLGCSNLAILGDDCHIYIGAKNTADSLDLATKTITYECSGNLIPVIGGGSSCTSSEKPIKRGVFSAESNTVLAGQCELANIALVKEPHYEDGTPLKKQNGTLVEWPATEKISANFKFTFSPDCIGKNIDFKLFEFDDGIIDVDPEVFSGNINNVLQINVDLKLIVGNILGDACESESEYYFKSDDTDLAMPYESQKLFSVKCNSSQTANTPWSIDSSTGGGVDPSNKDLYISRPILGTNADKLKPSFFTTVKNIYPATYGFVVTKKSDPNTEVANTYKNDPKTKTASSSENGESVSPIEILLSPPADIYKIVSHATDDHGNIEYSSEATIYDATTGTVTGSETFDAAEAEEQEYLASQGIMPIKVDSTKYQLLEPLGDYKEVKTDSIGVYVNILVEILIGIIGVMAVLVLVFAGVQYMTTQAIAEKGEAKGLIGGAMAALFIVLVMYLILRTINPDLLDLDPDITSVKIKPGVESLSDADYTKITGKAPTLKPQIEAKVVAAAKNKSIDECLAKALVQHESGTDDKAIGHDENVSGTNSRKAFLASQKTYGGITFSGENKLNDDPKTTPDWRFSHGIGVMQITLFPENYFTNAYQDWAKTPAAWNARTIELKRTDIDATTYTMANLLDPDININAGMTLLKNAYVDCQTIVGALKKYNSGTCDGTPVKNYVEEIMGGYNTCCKNSTCTMKIE